jgi:SRSO17 transposase
MTREGGGWLGELERWSEPFLDALGHPARRHWAPYYLRGLLLPGERKSVQPMAMRLGRLPAHDQLHNFVASPAWDGAPLEALLAAKAGALVGGPDAVLVVDDTALPKKGSASVGVAHQYAGALGKEANCQALVSLTLARDEVPVPVALRLFLPREWVADPSRLERAGVPAAHRAPRAKGEVALAEIDRLCLGSACASAACSPTPATATARRSARRSPRGASPGPWASRRRRRPTAPRWPCSGPGHGPAGRA